MLPIIAIRPEPGLSQTIERGREMNLAIAGHALFAIKPVEWSAPDDLSFDGLLIGSANAIRHGGPQLALMLDIPVYAVGETTAAAARAAGFRIAETGRGGLQAVLDQYDSKAIRFLRLSGHDHVPLNVPHAHAMVERIVYQAQALSVPKEMAEILSKGATVILHSAKAAEHFSNECNRLDLPKGDISLACLGSRIADAAGGGWAKIVTASEPNDGALLKLVAGADQKHV